MIVDRSSRGKVRLGGSEAAEFLQGQVTNDVEGLSPGQGCYAALLNHKGKMRLDMRILRGPDWIWVDTEPGADAPLLRTIETYSLGRDVTWETAGERIVSLIGEPALDTAPPADEHAWVEGERGIYVRTYAGIDVIGHDVPAPDAEEAAAECVRIEAGIPRFGLDMDGDTIPQEAGINDRAISFTKGCYVGQETVARLFYKGKPNRHLRGLRLSRPAEHGQAIVLGDREVGRVGSACVSPGHGPIALALVRREAAPGDTVDVDGAPAEVAELPFARA
jgi:folate-binding protein YgfZ